MNKSNFMTKLKLFFNKIVELVIGKPANTRLQSAFPSSSSKLQRYRAIEKEYIDREAQAGGRLFAKSGEEHQFFCLDETTWCWYSAKKENGHLVETFVTYEVTPWGVLKRIGGGPHRKVTGKELVNFEACVRGAYNLLAKQVYNRQPQQPVSRSRYSAPAA